MKFTDMLKLTGILLLMFLIFGSIAVGFVYYKTNQAKKEMENNFYESLNKQNQSIKLENQKQFEKIYPKLDSIAKKNDIEHIKEVQNLKYYYHTDSVMIKMVRDTIFLNDSVFKFSYDTTCLSMSGHIITKSGNEKMIVDKLTYYDDFNVFSYTQRQRLWNVSWFPRWGRKHALIKVISDCADTVKTINIKID